jgi:predicted nucleic acid-binding protein
VILADTTLWIDYFRSGNAEMRKRLADAQIATHPFIVAELSLGSLRERGKTLAYLEMLPQVQVAELGEVRRMVEAQALYSKGIGLTDAHLIASTLITPSTALWTRDKRLRSVTDGLGIHVNLP